jgi:hypothetical protein
VTENHQRAFARFEDALRQAIGLDAALLHALTFPNMSSSLSTRRDQRRGIEDPASAHLNESPASTRTQL